jgi:hypothetical protein
MKKQTLFELIVPVVVIGIVFATFIGFAFGIYAARTVIVASLVIVLAALERVRHRTHAASYWTWEFGRRLP